MKFKAIPIGLSLAMASAAFAGNFTPVPLNPSSFNADVVVEATATPKLTVVTTASVDQGIQNNANTWMEVGFDPANPTNGLPPAGTVFTAVSNANYSFMMPPSYSAPNGILIDTVITNGTFTLTTPIAYTKLSFLGSGGNGGDVIGVIVHHQDGSVETAFPTGATNSAYTFGCPDWFNGTTGVALIANERCGSTVNFTYANANSINPRLYFRDITLTNTASPVVSVDLRYVSGQANSHNCIFAMSGDPNGSGTVVPVTVTGYTYDFVVEASASHQGVVVDTNGVPATTSSMDNESNTGNSWYEQGYNLNNIGNFSPNPTVALASGLPHPGTTITNAAGDHAYLMPPTYNGNDAVYLSTTIANATITFASPTAAAGLSFLGSAGNGPVAPQIVINYQDGSSQTNALTVFDWFNTGVARAFASNGRVDVGIAQINNIQANPQVPGLFNLDLALLNTSSPVVSIDMTYTNTGGRIAIFAVSKTATAVPPTFVLSPNPVANYPGSNAVFTAAASGTAPIAIKWQKGTNGVYVDLTDGAVVSGSATTTLTLTGFSAADGANYRAVATNAGGFAASSAAQLTVLSTLPDVLSVGDSITDFGNTVADPGAQGVAHAIDHDVSKWLNFGKNTTPFQGPVGMIVTPSLGLTVVSSMRLYTANDTVARDPADYVLEGSIDGGTTWTAISSGPLALPDNRNGGAGAIDPITGPQTLFLSEVDFVNTVAYASYRLTFAHVKSAAGANSMQIGEIELLGSVDTSGRPTVTPPASVKAIDGTASVTFSTTAGGVPNPTLQWQRKVGTGAFTNLTDAGNYAGTTTSFLTLTTVHMSDNQSSFRVIARNTSGSVTSSVATLTVLSSLLDVTQPGDTITEFGDDAPTPVDPALTINGLLDNYQNNGHGQNASAGFPPFVGPAGVVVTPSAGPTLVTGLRIYTGSGGTANDPIDYEVDGSNDNGTNFTTISAGPLNLPPDRNAVAAALDPTTAALQEILFANSHAYTTYRVVFFNVADNVNNGNIQFAELELLGISVSGVSPTLTVTTGAGGSLNISSSSPGTLQSATVLGNPTVWTDVGPITGTLNIVPAAGTPAKFYRVKAQ